MSFLSMIVVLTRIFWFTGDNFAIELGKIRAFLSSVVVLLAFADTLFIIMLCSSSLHALQQLKAMLSGRYLTLLGIWHKEHDTKNFISKGIPHCRRFLVANRISSGYFLIPEHKMYREDGSNWFKYFSNISGTIVHPFSNSTVKYLPQITMCPIFVNNTYARVFDGPTDPWTKNV